MLFACRDSPLTKLSFAVITTHVMIFPLLFIFGHLNSFYEDGELLLD